MADLERLIENIKNELAMLGEITSFHHMQDSAAYGFKPENGCYYKESYAEISYADIVQKSAWENAKNIIKQWMRNDEIALNRHALRGVTIVKNNKVMRIYDSITWVGHG